MKPKSIRLCAYLVLVIFCGVNNALAKERKGCEPANWNNLSIEVTSGYMPELSVVIKKDASYSTDLPDPGPGAGCIRFSDFPKQQLIVIHYRTGVRGTRVLVQDEALLVYRISPGKGDKTLEELANFQIKATEKSGENNKTLKDLDYKITSDENAVTVTLLDRVTHKEISSQRFTQ